MLIHLDLSRSRWWGLVTSKQFEPGQTRETGSDLDPNHLTSVTGIKAWVRHFLSLSWGLQFVIADSDQVLHHAACGRNL